ncbi:cytidylate kinase family protein [Clostridioides difficile]|uniref:cytidylate kinase family protein n=1 Tax=Clostridioides difficile TaxID=1496 RepID=UPI002352DB9C|nr:cytidylate kinase family protein [Clostridioides difficile]
MCTSFTNILSMQSMKTDLLIEQSNVINQIASTGKDCVIVGRNADILLKKYQPFNVFVCANMNFKIQRCIEKS